MQGQGGDSCVIDKTRERERERGEVSSLLAGLAEGRHRYQGPLTSR